MRPTDENQSASIRPNLMSPRRPRISGEDSILAMLEREPAHKRAGGASGARRAWFGAGAGLALVLTGALVWLAANNDGTRRVEPESVLASVPASAADTGSTLVAPAALHQVAMASAESARQAPPGSAAVIVDQPPPGEAPPLRLLKPGPGKIAAGQPAAALRIPVPAAAPRRTPAVAVAAKPAAAVRPAAAPSRPRPATLAKNAVRPVPPKSARGGGPARKADGPVDADVALISAVIVHANGHAPEGSQMTELLCPNGACQAKPARE
ncbi:hypothetical protein IM543_10455 [Massilia sp. UMI-21]|nr:hypothetical protein IM543_10455 [Massilia sp. UMI-21]